MIESRDGARPAPVTAMVAADWPAVRTIYEEGVATGNATLDTAIPDWPTWDRAHLAVPRLVARDPTGAVLGWAALTPVSNRCVYGGVAEVSVYVSAKARGLRVGRRLLEALVTASEEAGLWTLEASILRENQASVALHRRCGFRPVGVRERLGQVAGRWRDVLVFERRSTTIGV